VGLALLAGIGLVRDGRAALRYAGLGLVLGWAATGIAASVAVVAGLELSLLTVIVLWALALGASALLALRLPAKQAGPLAGEREPAGRLVAAAAAALLVAVLVALFRRGQASGPLDPDVWGFWLPKAKTIFETGGIDTGLGGYASFTHPEYPPLAPASEAVSFLFMRRDDVLLLPVQHWVLFVAFLGTLAGLLAERVRPALLWPSLAFLALLPTLEHLVGSSLADEPLAQLFALAGVSAALWLLERDWRHAVVCGVLLAAMPLTKNEGLMLGLVLVVALAAATRLRPWRTLLALASATALAAVPWRAWLAAHDVQDQSDYRFGDLFDPGLLWDRLDRLGVAAREFPQYVLDPGRWLLAVPLALLLAALLAPGRRALAGFVAATVLIAFAGYLVIYWIGLPEIRFYLDSSAERLSANLAVFCAALLPLLGAEALEA
jgi:4-amino-4-deoxy-L-arabinose transferase-like glycosyltransferase